MSKEISKLLGEAMSDKDLFIELATDVDKALKNRKIMLSGPDKKLLEDTLVGIKANIAADLTRIRIIKDPIGTMADGVIGW